MANLTPPPARAMQMELIQLSWDKSGRPSFSRRAACSTMISEVDDFETFVFWRLDGDYVASSSEVRLIIWDWRNRKRVVLRHHLRSSQVSELITHQPVSSTSRSPNTSSRLTFDVGCRDAVVATSSPAFCIFRKKGLPGSASVDLCPSDIRPAHFRVVGGS